MLGGWLQLILYQHRDPVIEARRALAMAVSCGECFTTIVTEQGDAWACGNNFFGKLGLGDNTHQLLPAHVEGREVFAGAPLHVHVRSA